MVRAGIEHFARGVPSEDVFIVGDTPHDISSALDNGLMAVGVATGNYSVDQLRESGAQLVFRDFSDWHGAAAKLSGEA
jgi:phosphoglycolate phosphatase-like HAD superfamily hydrolase